MHSVFRRAVRCAAFATLLVSLNLLLCYAQSQTSLRGKIVDPVGRVVPEAKIVLLQNGKQIVQGRYEFPSLHSILGVSLSFITT